MRDLHNILDPDMSVETATITADTNGTGIDLQGFEGAEVVAFVGQSGDTLSSSVKIELEVEESDDNSTYSDVADADLLGSVDGTNDGTYAVIDAATEDETVYRVGYIGSKRYIRAVVNVTGTHTNGTPIGIGVIKGFARHQPTT